MNNLLRNKFLRILTLEVKGIISIQFSNSFCNPGNSPVVKI